MKTKLLKIQHVIHLYLSQKSGVCFAISYIETKTCYIAHAYHKPLVVIWCAQGGNMQTNVCACIMFDWFKDKVEMLIVFDAIEIQMGWIYYLQ